MQGVIKTIAADRGFGFITREGEKDLFFHAKNLKGIRFEELRVGDTLSFEIGEGEKGQHALNIQFV